MKEICIFTSTKTTLGNVRLSYSKNQSGIGVDVQDQNDYYPFGMNHLRTSTAYFGTGSWMNYKFGSKELQETGMYDYGARFYMPDIGRWGVIDPASELGRRFSPYNYAFDNPIMFVDPDGMWPWPTWNQVKQFGKGFVKTTVGMVAGLAQDMQGMQNPGMYVVNKLSSPAKQVYNAYQKGGVKGAVKQAGNSYLEVTGIKSVVETGKKALKGDPEAIGSATAMVVAAIVTHKATGGTTVAETSVMGDLANSVKTAATDLKSAGKSPATVVGAELNGQTTIATSGTPPTTVAPQLESVVSELGGIGNKTSSGNTVGCCAEFQAGNQLLLDNPSATPSQINFTDAIRPRTGQTVPMCENCQKTFGK